MGLFNRRMTLVVENCFTDVVSRKPVHLYVDRQGTHWLANDLSYFGMRTVCPHPDAWLEMDARRKSALASLPANSRPY